MDAALSLQINIIEESIVTEKIKINLNIFANIVVKVQTAAIVLSNNATVTNISKKVRKMGFVYLLTSLGGIERSKHIF